MSDKEHIETNEKVKFKDKFGINKNKVLTSLLAGFTVPFVLLICATLSVFFSNAAEFTFRLWDFAPIFIGISVSLFVLITAALLLTKGTLRNSIFSLCAFLVVAAFIQSLVTNLTFEGMPGDGNATGASTLTAVINFTVWVILCVVFLWFGVLSTKAELGRSVMSFLLVLVLVMQTVSVVPAAIEYADAQLNPDLDAQDENAEVYLTTDDMFELSTKENIVVIVLDRFDNIYFQELLSTNSPYLDSLDGFTYYEDNISTYPRTYPAVASMLTGIENDYSSSRIQYFEKAYTTSTFLPDLKANDYKINLYIPSFYTYDNANVFGDLVANTSAAEGYTITSYSELASKMFELSSYFWAPEILKSKSIGSTSFGEIVALDGDAPMYEMTGTSDTEVYKAFTETGLSTQNKDNTFTFLHLRGCHGPFTMDENCEVAKSPITSLQQTSGCFKFISEYIAQMKDLGIYDDATIIITGDHATLDSDTQEYTNSNLTGLLVKESGEHGTELKISSAQVSQDNFLATIIKSAGIKANTDYGTAYSEVSESETVVRTHYFQLYTGSDRKDETLTYQITGDGSDFSNWQITDRQTIGYMYK